MCKDEKEKEKKKKKGVKLDRFLRVMSGGLVVTDDLVQAREDKIDDEFGFIDNYIKYIEDCGAAEEAKSLREEKKKVEKQRSDAEGAKNNRNQAKLLETAKKDARDLVEKARGIYYQVKNAADEAKAAADARANLETWFRQLEDQERDFNKIGKNPVTALLVAFGNELKTADAIQKSTDRATEYSRIIGEMDKEDKKCRACKDARLAAQRTAQAASARCTQLPRMLPRGSPDVDLKKLRGTVTECETDIAKAFAAATDLDAVKKSLGDVVVKSKDLCVKLDDALVKLSQLESLKTAVDGSLKAAATAIDGIADPTQKKALQATLLQLQNRQTQGNQPTDEAAAKQTFFALDRDAIKLLESAHKAVFADKAKTPEGSKEIDDLIDSFGDRTTKPQEVAACRAALAARFNLDIEIPEGMRVQRLPLLFKLFAQVPAEHVGHDLLAKLEIGTEPSGNSNFYNETLKKIVLEPNIEKDDKSEDYIRQDGTGAKETVKYFSATALHEIGHGVDAKFTVMGNNQGAAGFGQWKKESLDSVIAAYYDAFFKKYVETGKSPTEGDLKAMLRQLLTSGACAKPAAANAALGSLLADWDAISGEDAFKTYCPALRVDSKPWNQRHAAGTRVYQESYANDWWSYEAAERQKGISNYQWRAPGEWFAEAYALWHLKQVKAFPDSIKQYVVGKSKSG